MNKATKPFEAGDTVTCRSVGVRLALQLGEQYVVAGCAMVGPYWMVQIQGPAGRESGVASWFLARRFVK